MEELIEFFKTVRRLSGIERCSNTPHIKNSYVSDHSYYVALYAMIFADIENSKQPVGLKPYDTSEVIKRALIHDLEESLTGDFLFPIKHENPTIKPLLQEAINQVVDNELFASLPIGICSYYKRLWKTSKDSSNEGRLVAAMDKFEILLYAIQELELGNKQFIKIYNNAIKILLTEFTEIRFLQKVLITIRKEVEENLLK
uniref:Putative phosphohydrolase n=1 Tax=viral metagenome TaxID=1070528 RepID=A0A6M3J161_9ZZZZ